MAVSPRSWVTLPIMRTVLEVKASRYCEVMRGLERVGSMLRKGGLRGEVREEEVVAFVLGVWSRLESFGVQDGFVGFVSRI